VGYCSFPDTGCDSGQRFDETAGSGFGNTCVVTGDAGIDAVVDGPPVALAGSCMELLASAPTTPSGMYPIDPDGAGGAAPVVVFCDMTTTPMGGTRGGWTLVFIPTTSDYDSTSIDYTTSSTALMAAATETLMAFRRADRTTIGPVASFALIDPWRAAAPFKTRNADVDLSVTITDGASGTTSSRRLRYGYATYMTDCDGGWVTQIRYGRICIPGTTAPFFTGFATQGVDYCSTSNGAFDADECSGSRMFTIAVR
jgi:hypothetical protein